MSRAKRSSACSSAWSRAIRSRARPMSGGSSFGRGPSDELGGEVAKRVVPRPHDDDRPALAPLDGPPLQPGQQPRENHRGLAAARRPQHGEQPHPLQRLHFPPQAAHEPVGEVVPAEEELGVVRPERLQPTIRPPPLPPLGILGGNGRPDPGDRGDQPVEFLPSRRVVFRNSTHEALIRNSSWATFLRRGRSAPGRRTGIT